MHGRVILRTLFGLALSACATSNGGGNRDGGPIDAPPSITDGSAAECQRDVDCNDSIACTIDHCVDGACARTPCTDCCGPGLACSPELGCAAPAQTCATDSECADGIACTLDRCVDSAACEHVAQSSLCAPNEVCLAALGCVPLPPATCNDSSDCFPDRPCLGMWACVQEFGCQFLAPLVCDDGDACTADTCSDEDGGCVHAGGVEICNGLDDDCDIAADEDFACVANSDLGQCLTPCGSTGRRTCSSACAIGPCIPPAEVCNGVDDDCNQIVDDGFLCARGATVDCANLGQPDGTATCFSDCSAWDTSGCTGSFDPSGTYVATPVPSYTCALGLVNYNIGSFVFTDSGAVLVVNGPPCPMTGPSAVDGTINVSCTLFGSCDEIYALTGTFTGPDTWTGTFTATFVGSCLNCTNQATSVIGQR